MTTDIAQESNAKNGPVRRYRDWFAERMQGAGLLLVIIVLLAAVLFLVIGSNPRPSSTQASLERGVVLQFGLSREPVARSLRLDLCAPGVTASPPECMKAQVDAARPEIAAVSLESDLVAGEGAQFPLGQFTISASNVGRTGLLVTVGANPAEPEDVPPGTYTGRVLIDRTGEGTPISLPVVATLSNRDEVGVVLRVLLALALGAFAGTLIKWLDESFSPLAALRRRQRRVEQYLSSYLPVLPDGVQFRLKQIETAIKSFDSEGVQTTLDDIAKNQDALVAFASANQFLEAQLEQQQHLLPAAAFVADVASAMELEREQLRELRTEVWPWEAADQVKPQLVMRKSQFRDLTFAMRRVSYPHSQLDRDHLAVAARRILTEAEMNGVPFAPEEVPDSSQAMMEPLADPRAETVRAVSGNSEPASTQRRTTSLWLLDNAWWLTLAVTATVIVFFGYQTQFLENRRFEGDVPDYFALAAWALVIQLAGGTIIETVGKLRTSRNAA